MENNKLIRLSGISPQSLVNGLGLRKVYFSQGCKHACKNCFNVETWDFHSGELFDMDVLLKELSRETYLDGVTFSGGDPLEQVDKFAYMATAIKKMGFNIWSYTGYTWEQILEKAKNDKNVVDFLNNIDVLVDGPFINELLSSTHKFRGSSNQRLIDVPKSINSKKVVEINL